MKTNNYLLNALTAMEAEAKGATMGIQVDGDNITESSVSTIAIVEDSSDAHGLNVIIPPYHNILASTTAQRACDVLPYMGVQIVGGNGQLQPVSLKVKRRPITIKELFRAREVISLGGHHVKPIGSVDGKVIGTGEDFTVYTALSAALKREVPENQSLLDDVPFHLY